MKTIRPKVCKHLKITSICAFKHPIQDFFPLPSNLLRQLCCRFWNTSIKSYPVSQRGQTRTLHQETKLEFQFISKMFSGFEVSAGHLSLSTPTWPTMSSWTSHFAQGHHHSEHGLELVGPVKENCNAIANKDILYKCTTVCYNICIQHFGEHI